MLMLSVLRRNIGQLKIEGRRGLTSRSSRGRTTGKTSYRSRHLAQPFVPKDITLSRQIKYYIYFVLQIWEISKGKKQYSLGWETDQKF